MKYIHLVSFQSLTTP